MDEQGFACCSTWGKMFKILVRGDASDVDSASEGQNFKSFHFLLPCMETEMEMAVGGHAGQCRLKQTVLLLPLHDLLFPSRRLLNGWESDTGTSGPHSGVEVGKRKELVSGHRKSHFPVQLMFRRSGGRNINAVWLFK